MLIVFGKRLKNIVYFMLAMLVCIGISSIISPMNVKASTLNIADGTTYFGKNRKITIEGRVESFSGTSDNTARFIVYKDGNLVEQKDISYSYEYWDSGEMLSWNYLAKDYGEYSVKLARLDNAGGIYSYSYTTEANFTVAKPKAIKKYVPKFSAIYDNMISTAQIKICGLDTKAKTQIYRATSLKGEYKLLTTTQKGSYIDNAVEYGNNYFYKVKVSVKSGSTTYTSKMSEAQAVYLSSPPAPVIKLAKKTSDGIKIAWKKNSEYGKGNVEFSIMRAESAKSDTWDTVGTVDGETYTFTDVLIEEGKTYYYKVQAKRPSGFVSESKVKKVK